MRSIFFPVWIWINSFVFVHERGHSRKITSTICVQRCRIRCHLVLKNTPRGRRVFEQHGYGKKRYHRIFSVCFSRCRALHSDEAEKVFQSLPQTGKKYPITEQTNSYLHLFQKVKHLQQPNWIIEITLLTIFTTSFLIACLTTNTILSIVCFAFLQGCGGCQSHSTNHSRNKKLQTIGGIISSLYLGLCPKWWNDKHNMHHIFTNSTIFDDDIKHKYYVPLYPLLWFKWRIDSLVHAVSQRKIKTLGILFVHYALVWQQRQLYIAIALLISGFFCAFVFLGNHER